ncbi:uncharacterized protein LOC111272256 [Varroa jacobsoni]|uniref:uncharacterized protein LOC111272256 n=1 Tax=Varroa jacobsoni TaxID=62625 RepID=UPI000BF9CC8F|nr:uncharacterized protein LOC111272256 [Varroa jacobsoni]XP_022709321.1 uncharacterized protein LOC111272256 [Varroa jacobsoni]XP_022709322.1 uncharacterized protein LOC111272256 [Varroa jacobsoni]XP_022709323.1 uncharacterized protein LOC111272256 [Varroa jacobsoni]
MAVRVTKVCLCCSLRASCVMIAISCITLYLWQIVQYGDIMEISNVKGTYSKTGISYTGAVFGMIVDCAFIIVNVIFLIGIILYRRQLFIPWIGVAVVMVIKEIIYVMFYLYAWIDGSKYGHLGSGILLSAGNVIVLIIYIVIVRSYYEVLKEEDRIGGVIV